MSVCFKRDLFGVDVYQRGVCVEFIADSDGVGASRRRAVEARLFRGVRVCGEECAEQAIRFSRAGRCPAERTKQVVVDNRPIERRGLKVLEGLLRGRERFSVLRLYAVGVLRLRFVLRFRAGVEVPPSECENEAK